MYVRRLSAALLVFLSLTISLVGYDSDRAGAPRPNPTVSVQGYEMYSWPAQGEWHFALLAGTKHAKPRDEIARPEVHLRDLNALKRSLDQLPQGEQVIWSDRWVPDTVLPPDDIVEEIRAHCEQRGIRLTMPVRTVEVGWDTNPTALIVRYYWPHTTAGLAGAYDRRYYIPEVQVWGNGRIIWVQRDGTERRVLEGHLTTHDMRALLHRIADAGFFSWKDEYYTLGGHSYPPMYMFVGLASQSKEIYEHGGGPDALYELREFLTNGAGVTGHDYVPARGYLAASPGPDEADGLQWPDAASSITLDRVGEGCTIEGEALAFAWQAVNRNPTAPTYVRSRGQVYTIMVQIPGVSFSEPPVEAAMGTGCLPAATSTSRPAPDPTQQVHPTFTAQPTPTPATTSSGTLLPAPLPADTPEPTSATTQQPTSAASEPPYDVAFTASPSLADPAGTITLTWRVRGASTVEVSWSDQRNDHVVHSHLPPSGNLSLAVSGVRFTGGDEVRFFLSAIDPNGELIMGENGRAVAEVLIVPLKTDMTIASFTANPDPIERGGTVTLAWDAPNARSVSITRLSPEGGIFLAPEALGLPPSGSIALSVPEEYVMSVTYYLGARDQNGVIQGTYATVSVACPHDTYITPECPLTHDSVDAAYAPFEHGHMVWRGDTREIYVLYGDGSYETYEDTWEAGQPIDSEETPPQGLLVPIRGFGHLWATHRGVRDRLGWATKAESGYGMLVETIRTYFGRYPRSVVYFRLPDDRVVHLDSSVGRWEYVLPTEGRAQMDSGTQCSGSVSDCRSYSSDEYRFTFAYPSGVVLELPLKGDTPVIVHTDDEEAFRISARKEYPPGDAIYFLDIAPSGVLAVGDNVWQVYDLPHGYGDGPAVSRPMLALQMEARGILYTIVFQGQMNLSPVQGQILSTFQLLD